MQSNQTEQNAIANVKPVVSAITLAYGAAYNGAQMLFAVAMALETLPEVLAEKSKFTWSEYNANVEKASGYTLALKTIQNSATLARQLQAKFAKDMATYGEFSETSITGFADFLRETLKPTTYTLKRDDLILFCKGEPSQADAKAAAERAKEEARQALENAKRQQQADAAAAAAAPAAAPAPLEQVIQQQADAAAAEQEEQAQQDAAAAAAAERAAKVAETARIQALALQAERDELAQKLAQAEEAKQRAELAERQAKSYEFTIGIDAHGAPVVNMVNVNPNPDFLEQAAKLLTSMARTIRKNQKEAMKDAA